MCGVMLAMIIFVLDVFKFPVTLNSFMHFPSYTNFIFVTVSYRSSSSCCCSLAAAGSWCYFFATFSSFVAVGFCCCSSASFSTMSFNLSLPYPIFSIILLYNKEAVSHTLCSLSAISCRIDATGADTTLYNFEIVFLKNVFLFINKFLINFLNFLWIHYAQATSKGSSINVKNDEK